MKKNPANTKKQRVHFNIGFTLVELLIVIAILGGLAVMFITSYPASRRRARDANRRSDLKQYQVALEKFANANEGFYPIIGPVQVDLPAFCATILGFASSVCPADPTDGESVCNSNLCRYFYWGSATRYVLWGALEQPQTNDFWIVCSNGRSGESVTEPTSSTCPL